ncbi:MarR family winged helix-turn-helix transcriptional regulator [Taibaiella koreensis]|uniref:MarR family winged helix-turn-helix transcriptional regulator n=1 Tax=Taibaiella koreensis TaxID=1268548 RepID=UPI000E59B5FE|nr:MarR family winged helix-turn-helix transcriptional regulator [Taibaiella koreensis]
MNIIDEAGLLALATRLQRLSERMRKDGEDIYKAMGIHFQPKWFPVIYVLLHRNTLSVVEIAGEIGYSHPSTITLLKELEKEKLIRSGKDKADERKRLLQLSAKGRKLVTQMEPVWDIITAATIDLIDTQHNLMRAIEEVEERFRLQSFLQRALSLIKAHKEDDATGS